MKAIFCTLVLILLLLLCSAPSLSAQTYIFGQLQLPVGTWPEAIATGDFNNDGILDMVVVNMSDNSVSVLLGKPNGTFQPQIVYPVGTQPLFVAVGDFNGDGNLDLAVANENCAGDPFNAQSCGPVRSAFSWEMATEPSSRTSTMTSARNQYGWQLLT
jgi:hypothetical protein